MKHYETAYSKFESVLYGATEQNGIVVEGQEIEAELVSTDRRIVVPC